MARDDGQKLRTLKDDGRRAKQADEPATVDTDDEQEIADLDLGAGPPNRIESMDARLDVFREGTLEGLEATAEEQTGEIPGADLGTDQLGNAIARHDGPGIADMFDSGKEFGLSGIDRGDPLADQPSVDSGDTGAPETPFKDDPGLASAGKHGETTASDLQGFLGVGGSGQGSGPSNVHPGQVHQILNEAGVYAAGQKAQDIEKQKEQEERKKIQEEIDRKRQEEEQKKQEQLEKEAKEKAEREAKEKAEKEAKEKAEKEAKEKAEKEAKEKAKKEGDKDEDDDETYVDPDQAATTQVVMPAEPPLDSHDLIGYRAGDGTEEPLVAEFDPDVVAEHRPGYTGTPDQDPEYIEVTLPPAPPAERVAAAPIDYGNPLDGNQADPWAGSGTPTNGPHGGGGETDQVVATATADPGAAIDAGVPLNTEMAAPTIDSGAPTVDTGTDFAAPAPDAAMPTDTATDYDDDLAEGGPFPGDQG